VVSAGFSVEPDFVVGMAFTRSVFSSSRATVIITVRLARSGMSSTNTMPPYGGDFTG